MFLDGLPSASGCRKLANSAIDVSSTDPPIERRGGCALGLFSAPFCSMVGSFPDGGRQTALSGPTILRLVCARVVSPVFFFRHRRLLDLPPIISLPP